jgi:hypothetical protein
MANVLKIEIKEKGVLVLEHVDTFLSFSKGDVEVLMRVTRRAIECVESE